MVEIHELLLACNWIYAAYRALPPNEIDWPYFQQLQEHPSWVFFFQRQKSVYWKAPKEPRLLAGKSAQR